MSPRMRSKPISHGIFRYDKYTQEIHIPKLLVLFGKDAEKIAGFMKKMDFQNASDGIVLTKEIKKMFKNFNEKMLNSSNVAIVVLETSNTLSILFRTPSPMVELDAAIEKEKKHSKFYKNTVELERFWKRLLRKWAKVLFDFVNENYANRSFSFELDKYGNLPSNGDGNAKKEGAVSFDPTSGIFDVVVQTFDVPIKRIGKNSMAVVLGDALAAQHPLTGSGMSSGRMAVDRFLNRLHDLNGPYSEEKIEHFIEKVKKDLNGVKKHVTEFAKLVVDINDDDEAKIDENITLLGAAEEEKPTAGRI